MNTTMTCNPAAINPVHADVHSLLSLLRRLFNAPLKASHKALSNLPADMAAGYGCKAQNGTQEGILAPRLSEVCIPVAC